VAARRNVQQAELVREPPGLVTTAHVTAFVTAADVDRPGRTERSIGPESAQQARDRRLRYPTRGMIAGALLPLQRIGDIQSIFDRLPDFGAR
jgi:hypothetical protein